MEGGESMDRNGEKKSLREICKQAPPFVPTQTLLSACPNRAQKDEIWPDAEDRTSS